MRQRQRNGTARRNTISQSRCQESPYGLVRNLLRQRQLGTIPMEQSARRHEEDRYAYRYRPILCTRPTSVVRHKRNFRYTKKQVCLRQIACRSCRKGHGSVCWPLLRRELLEKPNLRNMARRACQPLQPHGNRDKCALRHTAGIQRLVHSPRARTLRLQYRREDEPIQNALCRPHLKSFAPA